MAAGNSEDKEIEIIELEKAIKRNDLINVKKILEPIVDKANFFEFMRTKFRNSFLITAVKNAGIQVLEYIYENGGYTELEYQDLNQYTALMYSVNYGKEENMHYLISKGAEISKEKRSSLLVLAAYSSKINNVDVPRFFLAKGVGVDEMAFLSDTALMIAAKKGKKQFVEFLVENGADVNKKNYYGETALSFAVKGGDIGIVIYLVENGANLNAGKTPILMVAAKEGKKDIFKYLVSKGANINVLDQDRDNLLAISARKLDRESVELLVARGFDINIKDSRNRTVLMNAAIGGGVDTIRYLMGINAGNIYQQDSLGYNLLMHLIDSDNRERNIDIIRDIIKAIDVLNMQNHEGKTALMIAREKGSTLIMSELIAAGADVNIQNNLGSTVLIGIIESPYWGNSSAKEDQLRIVINSGRVNFDLKDNNGKTALIYAISGLHLGKINIVPTLIERGANINLADNNGATPLMHAILMDDKENKRALIQAGANIHLRDNSGITALSYAIFRRDTEFTISLINAGADINSIDNNDNSIFMIAASRGSQEKMQLLIDAGVDINFRKPNGMTALALIIRSREMYSGTKRVIAKLLISNGADYSNVNYSEAELKFITSIVDEIRKESRVAKLNCIAFYKDLERADGVQGELYVPLLASRLVEDYIMPHKGFVEREKRRQQAELQDGRSSKRAKGDV